MVKTNIADIRQEYSKSGLRESELPGDPLSLFSRWLQEAIDANVEADRRHRRHRISRRQTLYPHRIAERAA